MRPRPASCYEVKPVKTETAEEFRREYVYVCVYRLTSGGTHTSGHWHLVGTAPLGMNGH